MRERRAFVDGCAGIIRRAKRMSAALPEDSSARLIGTLLDAEWRARVPQWHANPPTTPEEGGYRWGFKYAIDAIAAQTVTAGVAVRRLHEHITSDVLPWASTCPSNGWLRSMPPRFTPAP